VEILKGLAAGERIIVSTYAPYHGIDRIDIRGPIDEPTSEGELQP
jgi:hypothetical protein